MIITIDLTELDFLQSADTELKSIDAELISLIQSIASGTTDSEQSVSKRLDSIIKRSQSAKSTGNDNLKLLAETYARGYFQDAITRAIAPQKQALLQRARDTQHRINKQLPAGSTGVTTIRARQDIIQQHNEQIARDIEALVNDAIRLHFADVLPVSEGV